MNDAVLNAVQVSPSEKISFRCTGCSACCRHVRQSVVLESLDVFRITKYLRDRDSNIKSTDDFLEKHAEIALLDECGFFVFMLKVQDADDACVFLKENRCMIHSVKPRACRIYPFIASPTENGRFEYLVSKEQTHHFKGPNVSVSRWMNQYFLPDEREALHTDFRTVPHIARLLRQIPEERRKQALSLFWWYRYSSFDLDGSFLEQYPINLERLQQELISLAFRK